MAETESETGIGGTVNRQEDFRVLRGNSKNTDDLSVSGMAHISFVRSQYGHAEFEVDTADAEAMDGVLSVFTATDTAEQTDEATLGRFPLMGPAFPHLEYPPEELWQKCLAEDKVRYQGEIIAIVVAETRMKAHDATEQVVVDYTPLEAVVHPDDAVADDAPAIHEGVPDNVAFDGASGDKDATEKAFENADYTVSIEKDLQRVSPLPLEPRAAIAEYDSTNGQLDFTATTQIPHAYRRQIAQILDYPENKIDVRAPEMGGGFGARQHPYPEDALVGWCAIVLDRPVKWRSSRIENQQVENDGRGYEGEWELAIDEEGNILGVRADILHDLGAWLARASALLAGYGNTVMTGLYDIPTVYSHITGVVTNTARVDAYRGVTETPMIMMLERLIDRAAKKADLDPADVRRQNFIESDQFPYEAPTGAVYDSGDYEPNFELGLETAGYEDLRERQAELRDDDRYLGIGLGCWMEAAGFGPCGTADIPSWEYSNVQVHPTGEVTVYTGGSDHGQGHKTSLAQVASDTLDVPFEDIEVVQNDTKQVSDGVGTYASRTAAVGGSGIVIAAEKVLEKASKVAAYQLETSDEDIEHEGGEFRVKGAPEKSISFEEVAQLTHDGANIPDDMDPALEEHTYYDPENLTWPFGVHIVVVEVMPETGEFEFVDYVATEDCGVQINPTIVEGQVLGGTAQGLGQALYETIEYDDTGNLQTASLMDYAVPKAEHMPDITTEHTVTPSPHNPHGAKGVGESGTIGAPGAIINAIEDAIEPFDPEPITPPVTPEKIWAEIHTEEVE